LLKWSSTEYDVVKSYLDNQKIKVVEKYDFDKKEVKYSKNIKQNRTIKQFSGYEEVVRAFIFAELGYKAQNIEIEKEYDIGRPKVIKIKSRIDIIVKDDNSNTFLYIELKKDKDEIIKKQFFSLASQEKGQSKRVKYLVLYTFEIINDKIKDNCIFIDYENSTLLTIGKM
jgi:type I restriction enzyme M protein